MKNKKKIALVVTALALVVALVVGGTLMLWSSRTNIARNVVQMDSCEIKLAESGGDLWRAPWKEGGKYRSVYGTYFTDQIVGESTLAELHDNPHDTNNVYSEFTALDEQKGYGPEGTFKGFDWMGADARPGDWLSKAPKVIVEGSIPVYLKMTAILSFEIPEDRLVKIWNDLIKLLKDSIPVGATLSDGVTPMTIDDLVDYTPTGVGFLTTEGEQFLAQLVKDQLLTPGSGYFDDVIKGDAHNWVLDPNSGDGSYVSAADNNGNYGFYAGFDYYYADVYDWGTTTPPWIAQHGTLIAVDSPKQNASDHETEPLFEFISIPLELPNLFQSFIFDVEIIAFAVQADNYDGQSYTTPSEWSSLFPSYPVDDWMYGVWGITDTDPYTSPYPITYPSY